MKEMVRKYTGEYNMDEEDPFYLRRDSIARTKEEMMDAKWV